MKYNKIRKMDISNGPGVRVSIFVQGCMFHCKNCFNPETWDFNGGKEFTDETINREIDLCNQEHIVGLSILGGEPLHPNNIKEVTSNPIVNKFENNKISLNQINAGEKVEIETIIEPKESEVYDLIQCLRCLNWTFG